LIPAECRGVKSCLLLNLAFKNRVTSERTGPGGRKEDRGVGGVKRERTIGEERKKGEQIRET